MHKRAHSSVLRFLLLTTLFGFTACERHSPAEPGPYGLTELSSSASEVALPLGDATLVRFEIGRLGRFAGIINLSVDNLPPGVTAQFGEANLGVAQTYSNLTLVATPDAVAGTHRITVRARSENEPEKTRELLVTVTRPSVALEVSTPALSVAQNGATTFNVGVTRTGGFRGIPAIEFNTLPYGVTAQVSRLESLANGQLLATVSVQATSFASVVDSVLRMTMSTGFDVKTTTVPLVIRPSGVPRIDLVASSTYASALPGEPIAIPLRVARGGVENGAVALSLLANSGLSIQLTPNSLDGDSALLRINTTLQTPPGSYYFTVQASMPGAASVNRAFEVFIKYLPAVTISLEGGNAVSLRPGESISRNLGLSRQGGVSEAVQVTATGLVSGLHIELPAFPVSTQNQSFPLRISADASMAPGTYELVLTARSSAGLTHAFTLYVNVLAP